VAFHGISNALPGIELTSLSFGFVTYGKRIFLPTGSYWWHGIVAGQTDASGGRKASLASLIASWPQLATKLHKPTKILVVAYKMIWADWPK